MSNSVEESIYKKLREGRKNGLAKSLKESSILDDNDGKISDVIEEIKDAVRSGEIEDPDNDPAVDFIIMVKNAANELGIKLSNAVYIDDIEAPWRGTTRAGSGWVEGSVLDKNEFTEAVSATNDELGLKGVWIHNIDSDPDIFIAGKPSK